MSKRILQSLLLFVLFSGCWVPNALLAQNQILQFHSFTKTKGLPFNNVLSTTMDEVGFIWIGGHGGLCKYDGATFTRHHHRTDDSTSISNDAVQIVVPSKLQPSHLWVGTEDGLNLFNTQNGTSIRYDLSKVDGVGNNNIRDIVEDNNGGVWIGTFGGGVCRMEFETKEILALINMDPNAILPSARINDLALYDQTLYVAMENGGLTLLDSYSGAIKAAYRAGKKPGDLSHDIVKNVFVDSRNNVWVGTWGGGLNLMIGNEFKVYNRQNSQLVNNIITDICEDIKGTLWASSFGGGLFHLQGDPQNLSFVQYTQRDRKFEIPGNVLWSLDTDEFGNIWIGSFGKGLIHLNVMEHQFPHFELLKGDRSARALCTFEDAENESLWFGTNENGIMVMGNDFDGGKARKVYNPIIERLNNALKGLQITKIIRRDNDLVIGTDSGCYVSDYRTGALHELILNTDSEKDIQQNYLYDIEMGKDGSIWLSVYDKGLFKYNTDQSIEWFGGQEGLSSPNVYDVFLDQQGNVWAGTNNGLDLMKFKENRFTQVSPYGVTRVLEHTDGQGGRIWYGTFVDGVHVMNLATNEETTFNKQDGLISNPVFNMCFDKAGDLWVYTHEGMSRIKMGARLKDSWRVTNFKWSDGIVPYSSVHAFQLLSTGELVLGGDYGFNCFDPLLVDTKPFVPPVVISDFKIFNQSIYSSGLAQKLGTASIADLKTVDIDPNTNVVTINFNALAYSAADEIMYAYQLEGFDPDWVYTDADAKSATYTNLPGGRYEFKVKCSNSSGVWRDTATTSMEIVVRPPFWRTNWFRVLVLLGTLVVVYLVVKTQRKRVQRITEQEIAQLKQDRLSVELQHKTKELANSTSHLVHKNDVLTEIKTALEKLSFPGDIVAANRVNGILKRINEDLDDKKAWDQLEQNFNIIHDDFISRLTEEFPKLTPNDIKICVYMRMNLSSKEIASLLNIATTSLETSRIRIRKKIGLERGTTLGHFILRY